MYQWHAPTIERITRSVEVDDFGCWLWGKCLNAYGYGQIRMSVDAAGRRLAKARTRGVHLMAYEQFVGAVPRGLQIDHLCRIRRCCNPAHLEAVTSRVNTLRGRGISVRCAAVTECPQGHPYDENNTRTRSTRISRECRTCANANQNERRRRKRKEGVNAGRP